MTVETVTMYDTIGQSAGNIPVAALKVGGYVTGPANILWPADKWNLFKDAGHVRIDQSDDATDFAEGNADVCDVETGATTFESASSAVKARQAKSLDATVYVDSANVDDLVSAFHTDDVNVAAVNVWLANWSLNEEEASALIGTQVQGMTVVAVQWASPSSNPNTPVPGDPNHTLLQTNLDLSVAEAGWIPAPGYVPTPPADPTPEFADGSQSLVSFAKANGATVAEVIWATAMHHPKGFGPLEVAYFNRAELEANMPQGMSVWLP
jgi:hypothetical protein